MANYDRTDPRYTKRRAATRARISDAANRLFAERGYESVSLEEIAQEAGVAVRTLYLHFDSKAGILLDYFDRWMAAFVAALLARPVQEPLEQTIEAALAALRADGWQDDTPLLPDGARHPFNVLVRSGPPEVAGHVLQTWLEAITRIAEQHRASAPTTAAFAAETRAAQVMATWFANMLVFEASAVNAAAEPTTSHQVGRRIAGMIADADGAAR